jgi:hypothetical protein
MYYRYTIFKKDFEPFFIGQVYVYYINLLYFDDFPGFFRFVLVCFETICFGCLASIPKQTVPMFRLNRNKQKTNRHSVIVSVFCYFQKI